MYSLLEYTSERPLDYMVQTARNGLRLPKRRVLAVGVFEQALNIPEPLGLYAPTTVGISRIQSLFITSALRCDEY